MGVVHVSGKCVACQQVFSFNPFHVPVWIVEGLRRPLCGECVALVNPSRIRNGLAPIVPHPKAYQPVDETEWRS